eukprot:scaffold52686_cov28-Tisochrysis_lutea.AAC.4
MRRRGGLCVLTKPRAGRGEERERERETPSAEQLPPHLPPGRFYTVRAQEDYTTRGPPFPPALFSREYRAQEDSINYQSPLPLPPRVLLAREGRNIT